MKINVFGRHGIRMIVSLGVSLFILGLLFRLVGSESPDVGRARAMEAMRNTAVLFIVGYAVCTLAQTILRAIRYRLLLRGGGVGAPPGHFQTFLATAARNMFVDLLPARAGELSYVALLNKGYNVPADACFSSLAVSMFLDFTALLVLVFCVAFRFLFSAGRPPWLIPVIIGLVVITVVFGLVLFVGIKTGVSLFRKIFPFLMRIRIIDKTAAFAEDIAEAARKSAGFKTIAPALALSLGVRFFKYAGFYLAFIGVTIHTMPELARAAAPEVILALLAAEGGAALPIPALMGFGTYETGGLLTLAAMGYPRESAMIAMLVMHIFSQAIDYLIGGAALVAFFLTAPYRSVAKGPVSGKKSGRIMAAAAVAVCAAGLALLAVQLRAMGKQGSLAPPPAGRDLNMDAGSLKALSDMTGGMRGFMVWSSNRSGNHQIWRMSLPDLELDMLTDHPHTHYYPRISPDGNSIAFCRSQAPWVSQRDERSWDVYVMDIRDRSERMIAHNANAPTWSDDGRSLYFQLNGEQFARHDLATGENEALFKSGVPPVPAGVRLQTPHFNASAGRMSVTLRGAQRRTAIFSGAGEDTTIGGGCQAFWAPDYSFIYYAMDRGGHMRNMIMRYDLETGKSSPWLDMPGDWSHEYFPKLSADGRYMVLGACAEGHEHDTADYEIFLWRTDSRPGDAVRVTFNSSNDCWPDIHLER